MNRNVALVVWGCLLVIIAILFIGTVILSAITLYASLRNPHLPYYWFYGTGIMMILLYFMDSFYNKFKKTYINCK